MSNAYARTLILSLLSFLDLACVDAVPDDSDPGSFRAGTGGGRTLSSGGGMWINNAFNSPSISGVDTSFSLESPQGLATEHGLLLDPTAHDAVRSMVACALPAERSIVKEVNGGLLVFEGELGLAPEWEDEACDEDCQEWVSACLLAESNMSGNAVSVWMRADHPAIGEGTSTLYPTYEASFFGNLFAETPKMHYCQGVGGGPLLNQLERRTCTNPLADSCGLVKYTACQARVRCNFSKGSQNPDSPKNCVGGTIMNGHAYHTITTYVGPS